MPSDPAVLGYVAGIIDGEGYIGIATAFDPKKSRRVSHHIRVVVTNTNPLLTRWFAERFGGTPSVTDDRKDRGWKARCSWSIHGKRAEVFLVAIRPYLLLKGEQADTVLALKAIGRHRGGGNGHGPQPLPDDVVEAREAMKQRIHLLNRRGTA